MVVAARLAPFVLDRYTATALVWAGAVAAAGFVDDIAGGRSRGMAGHLASLARGRPTTGILKLAVGVAGGWFVAAELTPGALRRGAALVLIAVSTNLWNGLDVRPGRAVKWGAPLLALVAALPPAGSFDLIAGAVFGASIAVLPLDLRELGMLGDSGSNPVGFVAGAGLALVLPTGGLVAAAAVAVALQVTAETVTLSRMIESLPPLRWFDRLGRRPSSDPGTQHGP
jgi:hypothetical protein